jgi:hypothetical protein
VSKTINNDLNWQEFLATHCEQHAAVAWDGYMQKGRGVLVLNLAQAKLGVMGGEWAIPIEYIAEYDPVVDERGGWPVEQVPDVIRRYDPQTEIVVLVIERDGAAHVTRIGNMAMNPPQAYQRRLAQDAIFKQGH